MRDLPPNPVTRITPAFPNPVIVLQVTRPVITGITRITQSRPDAKFCKYLGAGARAGKSAYVSGVGGLKADAGRYRGYDFFGAGDRFPPPGIRVSHHGPCQPASHSHHSNRH